MTDFLFEESPHLSLLRYLAKGSLKQDLTRSLRLWVLLRFLYSPDTPTLGNSFTLPEWRAAFFHESHPRLDTDKRAHHRDCPCYHTVGKWLIGYESDRQWRELITPYLLSRSIDDFLQEPLFSVTRRTLQYDLDYLVSLEWLHRKDKRYRKVDRFPDYPRLSLPDTSSALPLVNEDLQEIASSLAEPLGGHPRFFIDVDYIVAGDYIDRVEDIQEQLKSLWQEAIVPPIRLEYRSVRYGRRTPVVYPVCLYYHRRAIYLCAFGESPREGYSWYNYRLDKIIDITPLSWQFEEIPEILLTSFQKATLPPPDRVRELMGQAWGFDFYLPVKQLLLRFDRSFHDNYIKDTYRHETFERITYTEGKELVRSQDRSGDIVRAIDSRSRDDAYYKAYYRDGDINVQHRLFSWRPHVEIFLPVELRQDIAGMVRKEGEYYR
jgi:CRISPR-associated protein (TIGR03985 family)